MKSISHYREKEKVMAYIMRKTEENNELLVFSQPAFPEAGIQIPAGTIEKGENKLDALIREVAEETGLIKFYSIQYLGSTIYVATAKAEIHKRHYYQLEFEGDSLTQFEHRVGGKGEDAQMIFSFEWRSLNDLPKLIAAQDEFIDRVKT